MAAADYRLCDVCSGKVFYDSRLNYEEPDSWNEHRPPFRTAGEPQYSTPELIEKHGTKLDYLGDWAVICSECAKTHKCVIQPIDATAAPVVVGEDTKRLDFIERADYIAMPKGVHIGCCRASIDAAMAAALAGD